MGCHRATAEQRGWRRRGLEESPSRPKGREGLSLSANFLPDELQGKLTLSGFRHQRIRQLPSLGRRPVLLEYLGSLTALKGQGRPRVGAIQDVEKLRPELQAGTLGNLPEREVLIEREVKIAEPWSGNAIAAGIAQEVRATARNLRESRALRCGRRGGHGHREAIGVDVSQGRIAPVVVVHGIASRNAIGNAECVRAVIVHAHSVPCDEGSRRNSAIL